MAYSRVALVLGVLGSACVIAGWVVAFKASATPAGLVVTYPWSAIGFFAAGLVLLAGGAAAASLGERG